MNILVVNPIVYTSETKQIKRAKTIKDSMIYDLCLAFYKKGHRVTLYVAEPFKPYASEEYPFRVLWGKCIAKKIFMPHCFPFMPELKKYIRRNSEKLDLIICSEVFSMSSLMAVTEAPKKVIIWHELAKHNAILKKLPSRFWYNIIAKIFMGKVEVVPRSKEAKKFISQYCKNTQDIIIDHGVNLAKFIPAEQKTNSFVVCSQLIPRKRIGDIIDRFAKFVCDSNRKYILYIIGEGELYTELKNQVKKLKIEEKVVFTGKLQHNTLLPYLAEAQALLVNTIKDNNMISIVESIAVGTPVITTEIPLNAAYIKSEQLGIVKNDWDEKDLEEVVNNHIFYRENCLNYRECLSTQERVRQFEEIRRSM